MSKIIYWWGLTGINPVEKRPSSMHLVDYYNVVALHELGWEVRMGQSPDHPCISFFHQGQAPAGSPSFHYSCTSSICTLPKAAEQNERAHEVVFTLNSLMNRTFAQCGINSRLWPHGVDPSLDRFDDIKKFDVFTIVNVAQGQFGPGKSIKGLTWLVEAVRGIPDVQLIQIGANWDLDTMLPLTGGPVRLGDLAPKIQFKGVFPHEETLETMAKSHLMVSTSVGEGCPLPSVEALGLGLPLLTTDLPYAHDWPFHDIVRRIPSTPFIDVSYLHDQPFSPRDVDAYQHPPYLYQPKDIRTHIVKAVEDKKWADECREYRLYARRYASWKCMLENFALPVIEAYV